MEIGIKEFADNSVRIAAYPKVRRQDVIPTTYDIMSAVKDAFDANGIEIPYPQRVVYVQKAEQKDN
jgi:small conductance mechanosensitive channel